MEIIANALSLNVSDGYETSFDFKTEKTENVISIMLNPKTTRRTGNVPFLKRTVVKTGGEELWESMKDDTFLQFVCAASALHRTDDPNKLKEIFLGIRRQDVIVLSENGKRILNGIRKVFKRFDVLNVLSEHVETEKLSLRVHFTSNIEVDHVRVVLGNARNYEADGDSNFSIPIYTSEYIAAIIASNFN